MTPPPDPRTSGPTRKYSMRAQWGLLLGASVLLAILFEMMGLPAALLLGPMIAGIILASSGGAIRTPRLPVIAAQTVVGCLVARAFTADIAIAFFAGWPLFLGTVLAMIAASAALGWLLSHLEVLPGTTAVWGTAPGGASAMMLMAGDFGADVQLVAFMQYLRVVVVAATSSIVAGLWVGASVPVAHEMVWFPPLSWPHFIGTLAVAGLGGVLGTWLRLPAGALLVPMFAGAVLAGTGLLTITLPPWLLAISYAFLGWNVGLGFTRAILTHAFRALPQVLFTIFVLIAVSGILAVMLVIGAGIDPLTAYLATCPGGVDSIAIIAASSRVDMSFVMALQAARLLLVLIAGPPLARLIARRLM
jgi:hypothetical protein